MPNSLIFALENEKLKLQEIAATKLKKPRIEITYMDFDKKDKRLEVTVFYEKRNGERSNMTSYIYDRSSPLSFERLADKLKVNIDDLRADQL